MELNYPKLMLKISNLVTVSSFVKGTLIFALFTISDQKNDSIIIIGLYFIGIAFLVNLLTLLATIISIYTTKITEMKLKLWIAIGFQLANIPIAVAYFYYVITDRTFM